MNTVKHYIYNMQYINIRTFEVNNEIFIDELLIRELIIVVGL